MSNDELVSLRLVDVHASVVRAMGAAHLAFPTMGVPLQKAIDALANTVRIARTSSFPPAAPRKTEVKRRVVRVVSTVESLPPETPISVGEIGGCKALLLEIIRRASYDWVLYRTSKVFQKRKLAEEAFNWIFKEGPGHPDWTERNGNDKHITSLEAICEALELDVPTVRNHIKRLTIKNVMSIGRPAEYRRQDWREEDDSYSTASMGDKILSEVAGYDDLSSFDGLSFDGE